MAMIEHWFRYWKLSLLRWKLIHINGLDPDRLIVPPSPKVIMRGDDWFILFLFLCFVVALFVAVIVY